MKEMLKILLIGLLPILISCVKETKKPNIVFIAIDDLRPDLGCYGNSVVHSPNIDKLASEGVLFENHFVNAPTCGASRQSLLTGMRPKTRAYLRNDITEQVISNKPESAIPETFIHQFKRNGYHTVGIGKISHSADGFIYGYNEKPSGIKELPHSWDELLFDYGKWKTGWNAFFGYVNGENRQSLKKQVKPYEKGIVDDTGYVDGLSTQLAISKLNELKNNSKPFFLGIGFFKPHLPFNSPKKYWDLYDRDSIAISPNPLLPKNVHLNSLHNSEEFNGYKLSDEKVSLVHLASDEYAKKLIHSYYACISYIDYQIGLIVNKINSLGLAENTIIVVWGDHGWHLGDQKVWGKHTLFENALKSALIIKIPKKYNSRSISSIVETVDIYPSLLELCNIDLSHPIDGESFVNLLENDNVTESNVAYSYYKEGISLRTDRYRLTKYYRNELPKIELYDHKNDPLETTNIAMDSPKIVAKLMTLLEKGNNGLYK
ncbi:MAG: sulfatase [Cyclobacteriaceae bacterium]|nr:sulfatase [Cyclobacteriaceae bacterium]